MIPEWLKQLAETSEEHEELARKALRAGYHSLAYSHQMQAEHLKKVASVIHEDGYNIELYHKGE